MVCCQTYLRDTYLNYLILLVDLTLVVLVVGCVFRNILNALALSYAQEVWNTLEGFLNLEYLIVEQVREL